MSYKNKKIPLIIILAMCFSIIGGQPWCDARVTGNNPHIVSATGRVDKVDADFQWIQINAKTFTIDPGRLIDEIKHINYRDTVEFLYNTNTSTLVYIKKINSPMHTPN